MLKTKLGAALAGLYLLGVLVVSLPFLFNVVANNGAGGLHSTSAMSMFFVMLLTAPGSWPAIGAVDVQFAGSTELVKGYLAAGALAGCALANAAAIYVFIWLCGLLFRFAFGMAKDDPVGLK